MICRFEQLQVFDYQNDCEEHPVDLWGVLTDRKSRMWA